MIKNLKLLKNLNGFSTLELLLAMALLALAFSAVLPVVFSAAVLTEDNQNSSDALGKAETIIQTAKSSAQNNYG